MQNAAYACHVLSQRNSFLFILNDVSLVGKHGGSYDFQPALCRLEFLKTELMYFTLRSIGLSQMSTLRNETRACLWNWRSVVSRCYRSGLCWESGLTRLLLVWTNRSGDFGDISAISDSNFRDHNAGYSDILLSPYVSTLIIATVIFISNSKTATLISSRSKQYTVVVLSPHISFSLLEYYR
jgi:hypothetical protein